MNKLSKEPKGDETNTLLVVVNHTLTLKCYNNKENIPYLAHFFDIYGNNKYTFLYDVFNVENGTIIWNINNKSKEEAFLFKKGILNRIKQIKRHVKLKIKKDYKMGSINNVPLWGQEKIDVFNFVENTPKFRIYYR